MRRATLLFGGLLALAGCGPATPPPPAPWPLAQLPAVPANTAEHGEPIRIEGTTQRLLAAVRSGPVTTALWATGPRCQVNLVLRNSSHSDSMVSTERPHPEDPGQDTAFGTVFTRPVGPYVVTSTSYQPTSDPTDVQTVGCGERSAVLVNDGKQAAPAPQVLGGATACTFPGEPRRTVLLVGAAPERARLAALLVNPHRCLG